MAEDAKVLPPGQAGRMFHLSGSAGASPMPAPHRHAELEVNLVRDGSAAYLLGNRRYDLGPGTMTWLFPAQEHILLDQSPGYAMWIGVFSPALVERICTSQATQVLTRSSPDGRFCRIVSAPEAEWLHQLFQRAARSAHDPMLHETALSHALLSAWDVWEAADDVPSGFAVHPAVEQAARFMRDEAEALSMEGMSARVGLSAPRLSLLFKQQTGIPLAQFRNRQRLERFLRAYGRGRRVSLLEAALEAGWGSYPQFHRVFTQLMGCSPAEYRRRVSSATELGQPPRLSDCADPHLASPSERGGTGKKV